MNYKCPLCSENAQTYGKAAYHTVNSVAGIPSSEYIPKSYFLAKCSKCSLVFKSSFPDKETFSQIYSQSGDAKNKRHLDIDEKMVFMRRFDQIEEVAQKFSQGNKILDIGCADGAMLYSWCTDWDKYGLEYSDNSTSVAINRGLKIIGKSIDDCQNDFKSYFDVITLVDVAEHIPNPDEFFNNLFTLLKSGGIVIIFTGTTDYWFWKLIKSGYWYESFAEHIIFWSKKSFDFLANRNNVSVVYYKQISHYNNKNKQAKYLIQLIKNIAFSLYLLTLRNLTPHSLLRRGYPSFTEANDHMLIILKK